MKPMFLVTAALMMTSNMAFSAGPADAIVADLQSQGYTRIEMKQYAHQIKAEGVRGTEKFEAVYDAASGEMMESHSYELGSEDALQAGELIRERKREREQVRDRNREQHRDRDQDRDRESKGDDSDHGKGERGGKGEGSKGGDHDGGSNGGGDHDGGDHGHDND